MQHSPEIPTIAPANAPTSHAEIELLAFKPAHVSRGASVFALVTQVDLLDVEAPVGHYEKAILVQIVHARVLVPLNGWLGVALRRAMQQHRRALHRRHVLRLHREFRGD